MTNNLKKNISTRLDSETINVTDPVDCLSDLVSDRHDVGDALNLKI